MPNIETPRERDNFVHSISIRRKLEESGEVDEAPAAGRVQLMRRRRRKKSPPPMRKEGKTPMGPQRGEVKCGRWRRPIVM
jgi:hypothetical protein